LLNRTYTEKEVEEIVVLAVRKAVTPLLEEINSLTEQVKRLESEVARLKKNSSNSSKPPSSDIVKPPRSKPKGKAKKNKQGGQKGHPRHQREIFLPEQVDYQWLYYWDQKPAHLIALGCQKTFLSLQSSGSINTQILSKET